jgi:hypothetical protein
VNRKESLNLSANRRNDFVRSYRPALWRRDMGEKAAPCCEFFAVDMARNRLNTISPLGRSYNLRLGSSGLDA